MFRPQYANLERGIMLEQLGIDPNADCWKHMKITVVTDATKATSC